jgi:TolA-binding protein
MLGKLNLESKNYPEATRYFEQFIAKYKSEPLLLAASLAGIAVCYENQGQFAEAAAKYLEAVQAYPDGPAENDYLGSSVRAFLTAGDIEKARAELKILREKFKGTALTAQAERLFAEKGSTASGS